MSGGQLAELGYSEDTIWRDTAAGRLHRLYRDVFGVGHNAVSRHGRALAAVLAAGEGALLSHRSAAWLWGLASYWPRPVEVTAEVPRRSRPALRLHSAQTLLEEDRDLFERVPVTAVPRTLLDFAAAADRYLESALSKAERRGLLDLADLEALIRRSRGFRGVARLRSALEIFQDPGFTRSGLERRFLALVRQAGLPSPKANLFIEGYELDMYWSETRFAVELDTYGYHGGHAAFEDDRLRQARLKLAGIEMIRVTGQRLGREPEGVMRELEQHLVRRRREIGPAPA